MPLTEQTVTQVRKTFLALLSAIKFKSSISLLTVKAHYFRINEYKGIVIASFSPTPTLSHASSLSNIALLSMTVYMITNYSVYGVGS